MTPAHASPSKNTHMYTHHTYAHTQYVELKLTFGALQPSAAVVFGSQKRSLQLLGDTSGSSPSAGSL